MGQEYAARLRRQALLPRILTALIGIPLLLVLLWSGGLWWLGVMAAVLALAVVEFAPLCRLSPRGEFALRAAALLAFAGVAAAPAATTGWVIGVWALVLLTAGLGPLLRSGVAPSVGGGPSQAGRAPGGGVVPRGASLPAPAPPVLLRAGRGPRLRAGGAPWVGGGPSRAGRSQVGAVILGIAYLATPFAVLVRWRLEATPQSVLAFLVVIWANDIAAYFVGLAVGRHKLAPRVSPGKSWEGALGGLAGGLLAGVLLASWLGVGRDDAAAWAVIVTAVSQAGDLLESALKRRAGLKDSGRLLPGHGGVLDRFDGILTAAPVGYILLRLLA